MRKEISITKIQKILFILHLIQWISILLLLINRVLLQLGYIKQNVFNKPDFLLSFIIIIILYNSYINWRDFKEFLWWKEQSYMYKEAYENINILNRDLRSQRHDFLNHIQILYSLVELEEYEEVASYLHTLYGDIGKLNKHIKTAHPAINALLQAKSYDAQKRDIEYQVMIQSKLEGLIIPSWEMCRCLGNLIDNGFEAVTSLRGEDPKLSVLIKESINDFEFSIRNTGTPDNDKEWEKWFQAGYTTKQKEGRGMGLYIVKKIVDQYKGDIDMEVEEGVTTIHIKIPKKEKKDN